jgi:hypothetical protein
VWQVKNNTADAQQKRGVVATFSYSGRSVARQQLLATSLRLDNTAPLGVGNLCAPDFLLAKSGFGGLNDITGFISPHTHELRDVPRCGALS